MIDERKNSDAAVRRAYRDIASERTPDALDKAVLRQARKAVRPGYARSRAWTRPVAWAATVALCVAVVLDVARLPETPAVPAIERSEDPMVADDAAAPAATQAGKVETPMPGRFAPATIKARDNTTLPAAMRQSHDAEKTAAGPSPPPAESSGGTPPAAADSPAPARPYSASEEVVQRLMRTQESSSVPASFDLEDPCPPAARADPDDWAVCIRALEEAGLDDAATEQRQRLHEAFPDFDLR
jgi:hypothetical protein